MRRTTYGGKREADTRRSLGRRPAEEEICRNEPAGVYVMKARPPGYERGALCAQAIYAKNAMLSVAYVWGGTKVRKCGAIGQSEHLVKRDVTDAAKMSTSRNWRYVQPVASMKARGKCLVNHSSRRFNRLKTERRRKRPYNAALLNAARRSVVAREGFAMGLKRLFRRPQAMRAYGKMVGARRHAANERLGARACRAKAGGADGRRQMNAMVAAARRVASYVLEYRKGVPEGWCASQ